ncbi:hypothetical protein DKG79_20450 [Escherichia fergusonii]|nr:hypothetical protein DKG79_20450 [Escherichia fergusonii]
MKCSWQSSCSDKWKFSASHNNEAHFAQGENGMNCRQDGMKCLISGMSDTQNIHMTNTKCKLAPTIATSIVIEQEH